MLIPAPLLLTRPLGREVALPGSRAALELSGERKETRMLSPDSCHPSSSRLPNSLTSSLRAWATHSALARPCCVQGR